MDNEVIIFLGGCSPGIGLTAQEANPGSHAYSLCTGATTAPQTPKIPKMPLLVRAPQTDLTGPSSGTVGPTPGFDGSTRSS